MTSVVVVVKVSEVVAVLVVRTTVLVIVVGVVVVTRVVVTIPRVVVCVDVSVFVLGIVSSLRCMVEFGAPGKAAVDIIGFSIS